MANIFFICSTHEIKILVCIEGAPNAILQYYTKCFVCHEVCCLQKKPQLKCAQSYNVVLYQKFYTKFNTFLT